MTRSAEGEDTFLGAALLFVAPCSADRRVKTVFVERLLQGLRLHDLGMQGGARGDRADAAIEPLLVDMHDQIEPTTRGGFVAKGDHLAEFPRRVDMQQR